MRAFAPGDIHFSGQIWSRALFDISRALGMDDATRLIVEAQFRFAPSTTYKAAALATVSTARALLDAPEVAAVRQAFVDRRILKR
jgi:Zn-dependent metalloprotease